MKRLWRDTEGSISLLSFGFVLVLLLLAFLTLEMGAAYENYEHCIDVLQRSCNSAVEANIDDRYRADRLLRMDTTGAETDFYRFLANDLPRRYRVAVRSVSCTELPPSMEVIGEVTFGTLFAQYDWDDLTFSFKVRATNYDLD